MKHIVSTLPQTTHNHINLFLKQRQCHLHALSVRAWIIVQVWKTASGVYDLWWHRYLHRLVFVPWIILLWIMIR